MTIGSIEAALPALARALDERRFTSEPLLRRAINANLRLGTNEAAARVAAFAADGSRPAAMRTEAAAALGVWQSPSLFDRVDGMYHGPAARRDAAAAHVADVSPRVAAPGLARVNRVVQHPRRP